MRSLFLLQLLMPQRVHFVLLCTQCCCLSHPRCSWPTGLLRSFPPPQHEPASSAEGLTQACDQSIVALPVDRLRGRWSTQGREALERSLPLSFLPARCTGSRSRCSSPCACQASEAQMVSGPLMCLTAFTKQVTPSSASFSCLQLAVLFPSLPRAHPCC